jgi:autotransporter-associated beta strand protein
MNPLQPSNHPPDNQLERNFGNSKPKLKSMKKQMESLMLPARNRILLPAKARFWRVALRLGCALLSACLLAQTGSASETLIDPTHNNGSFELPASGKVTFVSGNIPNWAVWTEASTASNDSGAQNSGNSSQGTRDAYLQSGNADYNMTTWVVSPGDQFTFSWDHVSRNSSHTVSLVYDNSGTITSITDSAVTSTTVGNGKGGSYTIPAGSPAIGHTIGIGIKNNNSNYPEVDNFVLSVVPGINPLTITANPAALLVAPGGSGSFSVSATSSGNITGYQWYLGASGDTASPVANGTDANGTVFSGATAGTLNLSSAAAADSGNTYWCQVTSDYNGGTTANSTAATLTVMAVAPAVTADTTLTPSLVVANTGSSVSMTAAFSGTSPMAYQWQYSPDGTTGAAVNIPGATNTTYVIANPQFGNAGYYRLVASNSVSAVPSSLAPLMVSAPLTVTDFGTGDPTPATDDIFQLSTDGNVGSPGGLNYYTDNSTSTGLPGQTFTTGPNSAGYYLNSLYVKMGSINGGASANTWTLRFYSLTNAYAGNATLIATFTNRGPAIALNHWVQFQGPAITFQPNTVYAYSIGDSGGYIQVANSTNKPAYYSGGQSAGQLALLRATSSALNTVNFGNTTNYDGTFLLNLAPGGYPFIYGIAGSVTNGSTLYAGTPVSFGVSAVGAGLTYYWQVDGNVRLATSQNTWNLDTSALSEGAHAITVLASNSLGTATSSALTLNVLAASGPQLVSGATVNVPVVIVGNAATFTASFTGSQPVSYQWYFDNGSGAAPIAGATNTTYALTNAQLASQGNYYLRASNNPPGVGASTLNSASAFVYVVPAPQTNTAAATIADGGSGDPIVGADDISQLTDTPTSSQGILNNGFYVDSSTPPGQIFTTGNTPPAGGTYPLNYFYFKQDASGNGSGNATAQTYTLRVYQMLDGTNAQLLTSYTTANATTFGAGDWIFISGLTNNLQPNTAYAVSLQRNTSGYFRLASTLYYGAPGPNGQAVKTPVTGGAMLLSGPDADGFYYDATFVAGLTPPTVPVELAPMTIVPSPVYVGQGPVTMTASFTGQQPITYQWQVDTGSGYVNIPDATNTTYVIPTANTTNAGTYICWASNAMSAGTPSPSTAQYLTVNATPDTLVANYAVNNAYNGPGVLGSGTYWNQLDHSSTNLTSTADDGSTPASFGIGITTLTYFNGGATGIPLFQNYLYANDGSSHTFTFTDLIPGVYNVAIYSGDIYHGSHTSFSIGSVTNGVTNTVDNAFVQGNNYVLFTNVVPTNGVINGTWARPVGINNNDAVFNGLQLQLAWPLSNPHMFIVSQPTNVSAVVGYPVSINVTAEGPGADGLPGAVFYQWYDLNNNPMAGATNSAYAPDTSVAFTNTYHCVITNLTGLSITSDAATISVYTPNTLVWRGTAGDAWDTSTLNWFDPALNADGVAYADGNGVRFDDSASDFNVNNTTALSPLAVLVTNDVNNYVFYGSGTISGLASLTKTGNGTLTISNNQAYVSGTVINGGTLVLAKGGSAGAIAGALTINSGATVSLRAVDALGYGAASSATPVNLVGGTLDNATTGNEGYVTTFNLTGGTLSSSGGGSYNMNGASGVMINSLASATLSTVSAPVALRSDGMVISTEQGTVPGGIDLEISGPIKDAGGRFITKTGPGTLLLSGVNTFNGNITINEGALVVGGNGVLNSGAFTATVINNGFFKYAGFSAQALGPVSGAGNLVQDGPGQLTINGVTSYAGDTTVNGGTLDIVQGPLAENSTVTVAGGATLKLDFASVNTVSNLVLNGVSQPPGIYNSANSSPYITGTGSLQILGAGPGGPVAITNSMSGNTLSLAWPAGQGWRLQMQTNGLSAGLGTNWAYVTDGSISSTNITINPNLPTAFYRLVYP